MENKDNGYLKTYSAIFKDIPECDESYFIKLVLDKYFFEPYFFEADKISPLIKIDQILWHEDEPFHSPNLFIQWCICQRCNQDNVRILLDGLDGDNVVSHGEGYLEELVNKKEFKIFYNEITGTSKRINIPVYKIIFSLFISFLPENIKKLLRKASGEDECPFFSDKYINKDFISKINLKNRIQDKCDDLNSKYTAKEIHYNILNDGFDQVVYEMVDKISAAFNVEMRYPFLDKRLIEFCYAVPTEQKRHNGWDRIIMRRAMENILPTEIQWRKDKKYLNLNYTTNLIRFEKDLFEDLIFKNKRLIEDYVDIDALIKAYNLYNLNKNETDIISVYNIWKSIILWLWISKIE